MKKVNIAPAMTEYNNTGFIVGEYSIYPAFREIIAASFEISRAFTEGDLQRSMNE